MTNETQKVAGLTDYLSRCWIELRESEAWAPAQEGLTFVLPREGAGLCGVGADAPLLKPGDVLAIRQGGNGPVRAGAGGLKFWSFSICLEHVLPLFASHEIASLQSVLANLKQLRFYPAASGAARMCHRLVAEAPKESGLEHRSQILRAASTILAEELRRTRPTWNGYECMEEHVRQKFEALSADELLHLSVDDLAKRFNCSRRHLNRLFHHHFGLAVANLRMELRLLKAVSLLRDPAAKVINVAGDCGFNHLGLFTTCFRRRFGVSPGEWRRQAQDAPVTAEAACSAEDGSQCLLKHSHLCPCNLEKPGEAATLRERVSGQVNGNGNGNGKRSANGKSNGHNHGLVPARALRPPGDRSQPKRKGMPGRLLGTNGTRLHLQIDLAD